MIRNYQGIITYLCANKFFMIFIWLNELVTRPEFFFAHFWINNFNICESQIIGEALSVVHQTPSTCETSWTEFFR